MALGRQYLFGPPISPKLLAAMFALGVGTLMLLFGFGRLLPWWTRSDAVVVLLFALIILGGARPAGNGALLALLALCPARRSKLLDLHPSHPSAPLVGIADFGLSQRLNFVVYFGVVMVASVLSFHYVETPLRRLIGGRRLGDAQVVTGKPLVARGGVARTSW